MQPLTIAIGDYGITRGLKDGSVKPRTIELRHIHIEPITAAMRRMVRTLEFDICEMAFTTYLAARAAGKPIIAIPVFVTRNFHHWAIWYNTKSNIRGPKDLEGRRVGVNRGYTVTTGLWARGVLRGEYGVDLERITWVPTDDEHVAEYKAPANVDTSCRGKPIAKLLLDGEVDAAIGDIRVGAPEIQPLIPEAQAAGAAYYRKTGIYPVNHGITFQTAALAAHPSLGEDLYLAFKEAKARWLGTLAGGGDGSPEAAEAARLQRIVGDPFPFGLEPNRNALVAMNEMAVDQHIIPRKFTPEELFAPGTWEP